MHFGFAVGAVVSIGGHARRAGVDFCADGAVEGGEGRGGGGGEGGYDGGAGEDVRVGEVRPRADLEGAARVLGLDGACSITMVSREGQLNRVNARVFKS